MSVRKERALLVLGSVSIVAIAASVVVFFGGSQPTEGAASQQEPAAPVVLPDIGAFRVGSALGDERAGFSGMPSVFVFASAHDASWPELRECLETAESAGALAGYTPVLVDSADPFEDHVEPKLRANGAQVVIRNRQGRFLGALQAGFECADFVALLAAAKGMTTIPPQPSPLRTFLRQEPIAGIDSILARDGRERAERVAALFREFDGDTGAVRAAEARLAQ